MTDINLIGVPEFTQMERLAAEFAGHELKQRKQAGRTLTYISIDATINRLNEVLGPAWNTDATTTVEFVHGQYLAVCELKLMAQVDEIVKQAYGVGADKAPDPDKAAKTALAEAIKKAGHQLGIGLYLWDEDGRGRAENKMRLARASTAALKSEVFSIAKEKLAKSNPSAAEIGELFGVAPGDLADEGTLRSILTKEGAL
jgi:hypothetical protein